MERSLDGRTMKLLFRRLSKKELRGIISKSFERHDILKSVFDTVDKKPALKKEVLRGLSVGTNRSAVDHACSLFGEVEESNAHCEGGKCVGTATFKFVKCAVKAILASEVS